MRVSYYYYLALLITEILLIKRVYCLKYHKRVTARPAAIHSNGLKLKGASINRTAKANVRYCTSKGSQQRTENLDYPFPQSRRRSFLISIVTPLVASTSLLPSDPAFAKSGLVQFPCTSNDLQNTYHFMRSGQSLLEERDILSTNPLFLTNRENALSDLGREQVREACQYMKSRGISPSVVGFSLAANSVDSAAIVGEELHLGQNRLVPEFTFLDPRAVGKWDFLPLQSTEEAIWAMDATEAGNSGIEGRPPPNDDGTPNETLENQVTRLRQYFSVLETLYSGDNILLIFPDGTGPALLTALIGGIPLNRVHEINFQPGEIRLNINYNSAREALSSEQPSKEYRAIIEQGINQLKLLRTNPENIVNVKDQIYAEECQEEMNRIKELSQIEKAKENPNVSLRIPKEDKNLSRIIAIGLAALSAAGIAGALGKSKGATIDTATFDASQEKNTLYQTPQDRSNGSGNVLLARSVGNYTSSRSEVPSQPNDDNLSVAVMNAKDGFKSTQILNVDPEEKARMAMEEYLNGDDGGDAWCQMISGIIKEENETLVAS